MNKQKIDSYELTCCPTCLCVHANGVENDGDEAHSKAIADYEKRNDGWLALGDIDEDNCSSLAECDICGIVSNGHPINLLFYV